MRHAFVSEPLYSPWSFVSFYILLLFQFHLFATLARPLDKSNKNNSTTKMSWHDGAGQAAGLEIWRIEVSLGDCCVCANVFFMRAKSGRGPGEVCEKTWQFW